MVDPWAKAYAYGQAHHGRKVAHIVVGGDYIICNGWIVPAYLNRTPDPYPVCKNCLRTKRAKELGL